MQAFANIISLRTLPKLQMDNLWLQLPMKASPALLQPNGNNVIFQFCRSERRINPNQWDQYSAFMTEYKNLGHMSPVPSSPLNYFIPHHAVLRPSSSTTKLRVVFNASFKTSSSSSLNDILAIGPQIQPDLFDALIRF